MAQIGHNYFNKFPMIFVWFFLWFAKNYILFDNMSGDSDDMLLLGVLQSIFSHYGVVETGSAEDGIAGPIGAYGKS